MLENHVEAPDTAPDPLQIALDAIDDFDRSQLPPVHGGLRITAEGRDLYRRAMLRVAYAQAHEARLQTHLLTRQVELLDSIETLLIGVEDALVSDHEE